MCWKISASHWCCLALWGSSSGQWGTSLRQACPVFWGVRNATSLLACGVVSPTETFARMFSCPSSNGLLEESRSAVSRTKLNLLSLLHAPLAEPVLLLGQTDMYFKLKRVFPRKKRGSFNKSKSLALGSASQLTWGMHASAREKQVSCGLANNVQLQLFVRGWKVAAIATIAVCGGFGSSCYLHICANDKDSILAPAILLSWSVSLLSNHFWFVPRVSKSFHRPVCWHVSVPADLSAPADGPAWFAEQVLPAAISTLGSLKGKAVVRIIAIADQNLHLTFPISLLCWQKCASANEKENMSSLPPS